MDFKQELAKYGYNKGNSIDVEILINEILPNLFTEKQQPVELKQVILSELWSFCEKEFRADFEEDYISGYGSKSGMSDRTDKFAGALAKKILKKLKQ
jgi:hypothetical protein